MATAEEILCYNKGCGIKFNPLTANEDDCCHHPGLPVFHDAYKGWSCCNKKSTDFTTFLNMKGCHNGKHNGEKPPEKRTPDNSNKDEIIVVRPPVEATTARPDIKTAMSILQVTISQSLKTALENNVNKSKEDSIEELEGVLQKGKPCQNNTCKGIYEGEQSNLELCVHHPGTPMFHEGMKFWTCCKRKTSDFDVFLEQKGCSTGSHLWIQKTVKKATCRYDWHQTATHVYITVYAKLSLPKYSCIKANPIKLESKIIFGQNTIFNLDQELGGVIDIDQSNVTMAASKVEIKMKKADCRDWNTLFLISKVLQQSTLSTDDDTTKKQLQETTIDLNDIDLSEI